MKNQNNLNDSYDIIIVGAGPSGIFCAYKLIEKDPKLNILMIEKGNSIEKRICPKRKVGKCVGCEPCNITTGFSGAGAFSDGKLTLASSETGGNLSELISEEEVKKLVTEMDSIYLKFGADESLHGVSNKDAIASIRKKAIQANMKLVESPIRHLGTEASYEIYGKLQKHLLDNGFESFMVVGDDAQAIYAFRLADYTNIVRFNEDFKDYGETTSLKITKNFRSTQPILDLGNEINHSHNEDTFVTGKDLVGDRDGEAPSVIYCSNESVEFE